MLIDPEAATIDVYEDGDWHSRPQPVIQERFIKKEPLASSYPVKEVTAFTKVI